MELKIRVKESDNFVERILKRYMSFKLGSCGAVLLLGPLGKKGFYVALFDDAVWLADNLEWPLLDLNGVPMLGIPDKDKFVELLIPWIKIQKKSVQMRRKIDGLPIQEITQRFLH